MDIAPADTDDADTVAEMWVSLAADQRAHRSHILPEPNRETIRDAVLRHVAADELLVARDPDIVGFVMFAIESGSYEQDCTRGLVENIYVGPAGRNSGVGSELLAAAEDALGERGADVVALDVMAGNDAARRFYHRHGYQPHRVELEKALESDTL